MPVFLCETHGVFGAGSKLCECLKEQLRKEFEEVTDAFEEDALERNLRRDI